MAMRKWLGGGAEMLQIRKRNEEEGQLGLGFFLGL